MIKPRFLVICSSIEWINLTNQVLLNFPYPIENKTVYEEAMYCIHHNEYDIIIIDIDTSSSNHNNQYIIESKIKMLEFIKSSEINKNSRIIILINHMSTEFETFIWRMHRGAELIPDTTNPHKDNFHQLTDAIKKAIFQFKMLGANKFYDETYRLKIYFEKSSMYLCSLSSNDITPSVNKIEHPFNIEDVIWRTNNLDRGDWMMESKIIGKYLYEIINSNQKMADKMILAKTLARLNKRKIWMQFIGPSQGLNIPFELLCDENDILITDHILTRHLVNSNIFRAELFHRFLESRVNKNLRILIIGYEQNPYSLIPKEIEDIRTITESLLTQINIQPEFEILTDKNADYFTVREALQSKKYHILHFAGHGIYDARTPDFSGIGLFDKNGDRILTASDIKSYTLDSEIRFVFLSCCFSAYLAQNSGRGSFHGILDALVSAGIPMVLGYHWKVDDESARSLAKSFYQELWSSFLPAHSLFKARHDIITEPAGRENRNWATPVLLMQND